MLSFLFKKKKSLFVLFIDGHLFFLDWSSNIDFIFGFCIVLFKRVKINPMLSDIYEYVE